MTFDPGQQPGQPFQQQWQYLPPLPPAPPPRRRSYLPLWIGLAVLVLVLAGVGTWVATRPSDTSPGAGPGTTTSKPGDTKVITATDNKSQLTVPRAWKDLPAEHHVAESVIEQGNGLREQYVMVIPAAKEDFEGFSAFVDVAIESVSAEFEAANVGTTETLTIGDLNATRVEVNATVDGVKITYWFNLVEGKETYHQVVSWTLQSRRDDAQAPLEEVVGSFREIIGKS